MLRYHVTSARWLSDPDCRAIPGGVRAGPVRLHRQCLDGRDSHSGLCLRRSLRQPRTAFYYYGSGRLDGHSSSTAFASCLIPRP